MWISTLFAIIVVLSGLANLSLAVYVYRKNSKSRKNINFLFFGVALASCSLCGGLGELFGNNVFSVRATYAAGAAIPITAIFFGYAISNEKINRWIKTLLLILYAAVFASGLFTPLLVENIIRFTGFGFEASFGPLSYVWGVFLVITATIAVYIPLNCQSD